MINHKFSIIFCLSLCSLLAAQEEPNIENPSLSAAVEDSDQITDLDQIFNKQPELRAFYDSLSQEEKAEFIEIFEQIKDTLHKAFHSFVDIAETHQELIEKLKKFLGEENFVLTIGLAKGSEVSTFNQE